MMRLARSMALSLLIVPTVALANDAIVVTQHDKQFSTTDLAIEAGQTVTFLNHDTVRHNIALREPDGQERTGIVQAPGASNQLTFDKAGLFQVHCLIHPMMHLGVTVR